MDRSLLSKVMPHPWSNIIYLFAGDFADGTELYARMFAPALGVAEDPATGSAAAALAGLLAAKAGLADGDHTIAVEQGYEMGRPSLIRLGLTIEAGKFVSGWVGGDAVMVSEGVVTA